MVETENLEKEISKPAQVKQKLLYHWVEQEVREKVYYFVLWGNLLFNATHFFFSTGLYQLFQLNTIEWSLQVEYLKTVVYKGKHVLPKAPCTPLGETVLYIHYTVQCSQALLDSWEKHVLLMENIYVFAFGG